MIQIGQRSAGSDRPRAVAPRLLDCHRRIRHFTAVAARLADEAAPASDLREAAAAVLRYFTVSLPKHSADEDDSIAPRLLEREPELAESSAEIARQHRAIDETLARLVPLWEELAAEPERRDQHREALSAGAARLHAQFREHLALEEEHLIPAIERLPADTQEAILREMAGRRDAPAADPDPGGEQG